jgi:hypothetical protein
MMLRVFARVVLVTGFLFVFAAGGEANWHWYYIHVHQHYVMMAHYHQAMHEQAAAAHQAHMHQLAHVHRLMRAHVAVPPVSHTVVRELEHHRRHTHVTTPVRPVHWHKTHWHHERVEKTHIRWPRLPHGRHPVHIHPHVFKTIHHRWWKTVTHGHIHRPPKHHVRTSHEVVEHSRVRPGVPGHEHHLAEKKKATHIESRDEKAVVVRTRDKVRYGHGKKEVDIDLLIKIYYWTDDKLPRTLPKTTKPSPPLASSLPKDKPDLPRTLRTPERERPMQTPLSKPAQPLARQIPRTKTATSFERTLPGSKVPVRRAPRLDLERFLSDTTEEEVPWPLEEPQRRPGDLPPVQRARQAAAKPKAQPPDRKAAAEVRLALAIPRPESAFPDRQRSGDMLLPDGASSWVPSLEDAAVRREPQSQPARYAQSFPPLPDSSLLLPVVPKDDEDANYLSK